MGFQLVTDFLDTALIFNDSFLSCLDLWTLHSSFPWLLPLTSLPSSCFSPKLYCFGSHFLNTSFNLVAQPSDVCITQRQCSHQAHPIPSMKMSISGLPWWFSGWEFTTSAVHMGLIPVPGRFHMTWGIWAHVPQLLKPRCLRACALQQEKPPQLEGCALQLESSPHSLQLEKAHAQQQRPNETKINQ